MLNFCMNCCHKLCVTVSLLYNFLYWTMNYETMFTHLNESCIFIFFFMIIIKVIQRINIIKKFIGNKFEINLKKNTSEIEISGICTLNDKQNIMHWPQKTFFLYRILKMLYFYVTHTIILTRHFCIDVWYPWHSLD